MSAEVSAPPRPRAALRQTWRERLDRFDSSQLSVTAFCRSEAVSAQAFYYWKRQLARHDTPADAAGPRLLPVRLLAQPAPVEVVLPGATLRLTPGCDLAFVRSLLQTLAE